MIDIRFTHEVIGKRQKQSKLLNESLVNAISQLLWSHLKVPLKDW